MLTRTYLIFCRGFSEMGEAIDDAGMVDMTVHLSLVRKVPSVWTSPTRTKSQLHPIVSERNANLSPSMSWFARRVHHKSKRCGSKYRFGTSGDG